MHHRRHAAERRERVVHAVRPSRSTCRSSRRPTARRPRRRSGPPCPPCSRPTGSSRSTGRRRASVSFGLPFCSANIANAGDQRPGCPPSPRAAGAPAACPSPVARTSTTNANGISRSAYSLQEVGEPVRVLERVRRVGVEEPAAVRAELLDRHPARRPGRQGSHWVVTSPSTGRSCVAAVCRGSSGSTPWDTSTTANTSASGSRMRMTVRVRSTQKLPRSCECAVRVIPRIIATTTAMPAAADTKFCTVKAEHLGEVAHRHLARVPLPVRVGHEADRGVERAPGGDRAVGSVGLNGRLPCRRSKP